MTICCSSTRRMVVDRMQRIHTNAITVRVLALALAPQQPKLVRRTERHSPGGWVQLQDWLPQTVPFEKSRSILFGFHAFHASNGIFVRSVSCISKTPLPDDKYWFKRLFGCLQLQQTFTTSLRPTGLPLFCAQWNSARVEKFLSGFGCRSSISVTLTGTSRFPCQ